MAGLAFCNDSSVGHLLSNSVAKDETMSSNQSSICGKYIFSWAVSRLDCLVLSFTSLRLISTRCCTRRVACESGFSRRSRWRW